jgi:hypothetical protein
MIRNTNNEILKNLYGVFEDLKVKLDTQSTSPNPSYKGGVVIERSKSKKSSWRSLRPRPGHALRLTAMPIPIFIFGLRTLP